MVGIDPNQVTDRYRRVVLRLWLPFFRFHDLRHYAANIIHALGIPDQYIMECGGWKTDVTLKEIYRGTIDNYSLKFQQLAIAYFENMQHEKAKT